jgi:hypothetical protein
MAIVLSAPLIKEAILSADASGEATVVARQATEAENILRNEMFARTSRVINDDVAGEIRLEQDYNVRKLRRKEAFLTLNKVVGIQDERGAELFRYAITADGERVSAGMKEDEFNKAWGRLPGSIITEIMDVVYEANPDWNPNKGE